MALNQTQASIPAMVLQRIAANGSATILRKKDRGIWKPVSWSELGTRMRHAGMALKAVGFRPGDLAAVLAESRPEWVTTDLGVLGAGGVSLGIPPDSSPEQVAHIVRDSGCRVLFVENEEQLDKALAAREQCPALRHIVIFDMTGLRDFDDAACESFTAFLARGATQDEADSRTWEDGIAAVTEKHPALLQISPDPTGGAGRTLTHGEVLRRLANARTRLATQAGDQRLALLPMSDLGERVFGLYYALDTGIISNYLENPETATEDLQQVQPTVLGADAAIWTRLHDRATRSAAAATPLQRMMYRWALAAGRRGGPAAWLARALVLRQVRRELGLARLRLAYAGGALAPEISFWTAALGIRVIPVGGEPAATSAASKGYGAITVEA